MFKGISKKQLAGAILAGVITITGITSVSAACPGNEWSKFGKDRPARIDFQERASTIEAVLKKLVTAGTITQAQSDAVTKSFFDPERSGMKNAERKSPFEDLVATGTLTQAKADKIITAIKEGRMSKKPVVDILKELVSEGTITQAQSDAVVEVFVAPERGVMNKAGRKGPLEKLVTAGTITQAQADAIATALKSAFEETKK